MKVNLTYWRSILREAELELEAAATREALNRAAAKLMDAKVQLARMKAPASLKEKVPGPLAMPRRAIWRRARGSGPDAFDRRAARIASAVPGRSGAGWRPARKARETPARRLVIARRRLSGLSSAVRAALVSCVVHLGLIRLWSLLGDEMTDERDDQRDVLRGVGCKDSGCWSVPSLKIDSHRNGQIAEIRMGLWHKISSVIAFQNELI
jgi:hypothetical protein